MRSETTCRLFGPTFERLPLPSREFGSRIQDLDIDFGNSDRVGLAIQVVAETLAKGGESPEEALAIAGSLPLGVRIVQLLCLVADTGRSENHVITPMCPAPGCAQPVEITLPLQGLIDYGVEPFSKGSELRWKTGSEGADLTLRRPTGDDQRAWQQRGYQSREDAVSHLLETLAIEGRGQIAGLTCESERGLAEAMSAFDPLVGFQVATRCPHCDQDTEIAVDLEDVCLGLLSREKERILDTIHTIAGAYGWSETEILSIPDWRRIHYLERICRVPGARSESLEQGRRR